MISACSLAAFAVVTAENGGQLLLGHPVGGQGDGAFLGQAPAVLHKTQIKYRQFNNWICGDAATFYNTKLLIFDVIYFLIRSESLF